jgi:tRNA pseudouridine65 synthase
MGNAAKPLTVLWQDEHMVAVHKPAGWLVHRSGLDAHETRFVMQTLRDQLGRHVYPVHRLDKGTSGVLLMALTPHAARTLSHAFEAQHTHKRYVAMVRGWPAQSCTVDHALKPDDAAADAPAQAARTSFTRLATLQLDVPVDRYPHTRVALVEAIPQTGRRHQIRRHLKHLAHPIIGDATHGKGAHNRWWAQQLGVQRLWLHALALAVPHPQTGEVIELVSPIWYADQSKAGSDAGSPALNMPALDAAGQINSDWRMLFQAQPWQWDEAGLLV